MVEEKTIIEETAEISVEDKLRALNELQKIDSAIDKIKTLRGELPLEVQDLEDEIAGLQTRINNFEQEIKNLEQGVSAKKQEILNSESLITKYHEQQNNVRNNREYDSLSKEIEFQTLEIELSKKKIKEFNDQIREKQENLDQAISLHEERSGDLSNKKNDLDEIVNETQIDIEELEIKSESIQKIIESRLLHAYKRIRSNARNGLAVVTIERDACGGCFNQIPPQRQMDIKSRKKIIVCEYCGRILVDEEIGVHN
jgi:uncharacterized protein